MLQHSRKLLLLENRTTEHAALALKPENALDFTEANAIVVTTLVVNAPTVNESEANAPKANALVVITLVANAPEANALTVNAPPIERIADAPTAASPTYLGVLMGKPGKKASETGQLTDVSVKSLAEHFPALLCASLPLETSYHHRHLHKAENTPAESTLAEYNLESDYVPGSADASLLVSSSEDDELDFKIGTLSPTKTITPTFGIELSKTGEHGAILSPLSPPFVPTPALYRTAGG